MKYLLLILICLPLLAGCGGEARYLDREYGMASQAAWDQQIVHTDYKYAEQEPEKMDGITAEQVMNIHNETYGEAPEEVNVLQLGLE